MGVLFWFVLSFRVWTRFVLSPEWNIYLWLQIKKAKHMIRALYGNVISLKRMHTPVWNPLFVEEWNIILVLKLWDLKLSSRCHLLDISVFIRYKNKHTGKLATSNSLKTYSTDIHDPIGQTIKPKDKEKPALNTHQFNKMSPSLVCAKRSLHYSRLVGHYFELSFFLNQDLNIQNYTLVNVSKFTLCNYM